MLMLFIFLLVILVLDIAAWKWGVDSRSNIESWGRKDDWVGSHLIEERSR